MVDSLGQPLVVVHTTMLGRVVLLLVVVVLTISVTVQHLHHSLMMGIEGLLVVDMLTTFIVITHPL
jgi:hypothetical protein